MKRIVSPARTVALIALFLFSPGCSSTDRAYRKGPAQGDPFLLNLPLQEEVLRLNPDHLSGRDVDEILSRSPAPRIINLNGSIPLVSMDSFSRFLTGMGYPEERIRNPVNGAYSYSSYTDSAALAGMAAWYYEKEGMMPILIGHSQGGMVVVKILHELAGAFHENLALWNPLTGEREDRYRIVDPLTGSERDILGLRIRYASAIATGRFMRFVLGQWNMLGRLRQIPDTVEEFTGFSIEYDIIGSDFPGLGGAHQYHPLGSASVRNVRLPSHYSHLTIPRTEHLAKERRTREWINGYVPSRDRPQAPDMPDVDSRNILMAAEIWYNIKKYWCLELQDFIRALRRAGQTTEKSIIQVRENNSDARRPLD